MAARPFVVDTDDYRQFIGTLSATIRTATEKKLIAQRTLAGLCDLAHTVNTTLSLAIDRVTALLPEVLPRACRAGCWRCCNAKVEATPLFILFAAVHAQQTVSAIDLAAVRQRALTTQAPCPLLDRGRCLVYEARPPICRIYYSFDYQDCERGLYLYAHGRSAIEQEYRRMVVELTAAVLNATRQVQTEQGLDSAVLHLDAGLALLYTQPHVVERWLAGDAVFDAARTAVADSGALPAI